MNPNDPLIDRVREVFGGSSFSFPPSEPDGRMAAVLVPLVYHEGEWKLLFTRRSDQLVDHKGEVSFPGGSVEKQDRDFSDTALREAWEEIGLLPKQVQILGGMHAFRTVSNFCLKPVIGLIEMPGKLTNNPSEVVRSFCIPLSWLANMEHWHEVPRQLFNGQTVPVIVYEDYDGEKLWGITARITQEFLKGINQTPE